MFKFDLGDEVQCLVSGFKGVIVGRTEYLNGCLQYSVRTRVNKDMDSRISWIDEAQLKRTKKQKVKVASKLVGGPHNPPTRTTPPSTRRGRKSRQTPSTRAPPGPTARRSVPRRPRRRWT